jgi:DNA-binding NarL/FixJ family response regulator
MRKIRVVVVEDQDLIRQAVESLLRQLAGIDVVATVRSMSDAAIAIDDLVSGASIGLSFDACLRALGFPFLSAIFAARVNSRF